MNDKSNDSLFVDGDQYFEIVKIMEKQLNSRSGIGKQNLEINFNSITNKNGDKISQSDLNGIIEVLLFEINN